MASIAHEEIHRTNGWRVQDLTWNPMAVAVVTVVLTAFIGVMAWLSLSMAGVQTDVALLKQGQIRLEESQIRLEESQIRLQESQIRLEARINGLAADITEIKEGQAEIRNLLLENRN